jgi:hypothetical protein
MWIGGLAGWCVDLHINLQCRWVVSKLDKWVDRLVGWRVGVYVITVVR